MDFCISRSTAGHSFTSPNPLLQSSLLSIHNIIYYYIILYHIIQYDLILYIITRRIRRMLWQTQYNII